MCRAGLETVISDLFFFCFYACLVPITIIRWLWCTWCIYYGRNFISFATLRIKMSPPPSLEEHNEEFLSASMSLDMNQVTRLLYIFKMSRGKKHTGTKHAFQAGACAFAKVQDLVFLFTSNYLGERITVIEATKRLKWFNQTKHVKWSKNVTKIRWKSL